MLSDWHEDEVFGEVLTSVQSVHRQHPYVRIEPSPGDLAGRSGTHGTKIITEIVTASARPQAWCNGPRNEQSDGDARRAKLSS